MNNYYNEQERMSLNEVALDKNNVINEMEGLYFEYLFEIKNKENCQDSDFCVAFMTV
ncbi:hypothetical protein [Caloramator sp. E03]|uniref:hypothetical protein n=1 Tax=Caloramator sp. E03 TaxID=2576307 RepID=UPI00143D6200|nr:hypothetical protein [Caloramator sp. E03]